MDVRNRINFLREQRHWTINRLATEAELNPGTVQNWFKRKSTPTVECIENICRAFGISLSEFFNEKNEPIKYLSDIQQEYLNEFDLLDRREKEDIIRLIKTRNENMKNNS